MSQFRHAIVESADKNKCQKGPWTAEKTKKTSVMCLYTVCIRKVLWTYLQLHQPLKYRDFQVTRAHWLHYFRETWDNGKFIEWSTIFRIYSSILFQPIHCVCIYIYITKVLKSDIEYRLHSRSIYVRWHGSWDCFLKINIYGEEKKCIWKYASTR